MITLKHLIIFKEVARVKSMSKAAENLYISQPTISQKIQEIENYYNIKLFQRFSKTLGISEEGEIFLEHATKILNEMEMIDEIFFYNKEYIMLRVGITLTIASTIGPELFANLQKMNPKLKLQVTVDNTQRVEEMLLANQLDIALVEGDIHNDNIIHEPIIPDQLVLVCSSKHPLSKYSEIDASALAQQSFITREKGSGTRSMLEQYMSRNKISYHISWQCQSWESIKQAVIHDQGITLISIRLVEKEINEGLIHVLKVKDASWNRMFSLCYHKNKEWNDNLSLFKEQSVRYIHCPIMDLIRKNQNA